MQPSYRESAAPEPIYSTLAREDLDAELLSLFAGLLRENLATLAAAVAKGDLLKAKRSAHRTGGSAATYGFPELARLAFALEATAQSGGAPAEMSICLKALTRFAERVLSGTEHEIARRLS